MDTQNKKDTKEEISKNECMHKFLEKEYHRGMHTGDYVCVTCGETRWGNKWRGKGGTEV